MTATYEIHDAVDLKYVRIEGVTHLKELRDLALAYHADPQFSTRRQLIDLTALTDASAKFRDVLTLRNFYIKQFSPVSRPIPVAIAAPTDLGYGIARMFYMLMMGNGLMNIRIFDDLPAACASFGVRILRSQGQVSFAATKGAPT